MTIKKRQLNKEELDLWKLITKNDNKIGSYTDVIEETKTIKVRKKVEIRETIQVDNIEAKKNILNQDAIQVNKRMRAKLERGLIRPEVKLDLHGKTLIQARATLIDFVITSVKRGIRCILIITGKKKTYHGSKSIIREKLPLWLQEKELTGSILFHCYATTKDGADGARYILLRKKEKVFYD